jgi:hypothetical protein
VFQAVACSLRPTTCPSKGSPVSCAQEDDGLEAVNARSHLQSYDSTLAWHDNYHEVCCGGGSVDEERLKGKAISSLHLNNRPSNPPFSVWTVRALGGPKRTIIGRLGLGKLAGTLARSLGACEVEAFTCHVPRTKARTSAFSSRRRGHKAHPRACSPRYTMCQAVSSLTRMVFVGRSFATNVAPRQDANPVTEMRPHLFAPGCVDGRLPGSTLCHCRRFQMIKSHIAV